MYSVDNPSINCSDLLNDISHTRANKGIEYALLSRRFSLKRYMYALLCPEI